MKFTYVHSYGVLDLEVGLGLSKDGFAPSLMVGGSTKYWTVEIDVPKLAY